MMLFKHKLKINIDNICTETDRFELISIAYLIDRRYEIEAEESYVKSFIHYSEIIVWPQLNKVVFKHY